MASMDGYDPNQVPDQVLIPSGVYAAIISGSEIKPTKSGGSQYVFTIKITEGEHAGQLLWWRIHKKIENPTAKQIADRELKRICIATNKMQPRDTADFHNITCKFTVGQEVRKDTGETVNKIDGVEPVNAAIAAARPAIPHPSQQSWNQAPGARPAATAAPVTAPAASAPATPATPVAPPWGNRGPAANPPPSPAAAPAASVPPANA